MKVAIAQIKPITGDLKGNTKQIIQNIGKAVDEGSDIVLFPETAISGYCCGGLFEQEKFIKDQLSYLDKIVEATEDNNLVVVVGFVDFKRRKKFQIEITNSVATIQHGKIVNIYDKTLLANGYHHEDRKYFKAGDSITISEVEINGKPCRIAIPVCEDIWNEDHYRDIVSEMVLQECELILCPNYSYFYYGKRQIRENIVKQHVEKHGIPMVFCNAVGVGDIVKNIMIFDGGSFAISPYGKITQCKFFKTDFQIFDTEETQSLDKVDTYHIEDPDYNRDLKYKEIFDALVFEQKEMFKLIGLEKAQVHISGGVDSAVIASIVAESMGVENCVFVSNPTEYNGDETKGYAQYISDQLGVKLLWNPTQTVYESVLHEQEKTLGETANDLSRTTMQAVGRTVQGLSLTNQLNSGIVATGNHTEMVLGWATFHDIGSVGVHSPIADLTKLEVFDLCNYINERFGKVVIPEELFNGDFKPAAELVDASEDPFDYNVMSGICASLIRDTMTPTGLIEQFINRELPYDYYPDIEIKASGFRADKEEFIGTDVNIYEYFENGLQTIDKTFDQMVYQAFTLSKRSVYKQAQAAPIVNLSPRTRGFSSRETIINYYQPL